MPAPNSSSHPSEIDDDNDNNNEGEDAMLDAAEADEEIIAPDDDDHPMDSDDDGEEDGGGGDSGEIELQNDSVAHFDAHTDSLFAIAQHPRDPTLIATGSGDDTAYVFSTAGVEDSRPAPLLPPSYESNPQTGSRTGGPGAGGGPRESLAPLAHLTGHTDSVAALAFSLPDGAYLLTAGLDGRVRAWEVPHDTRDHDAGRLEYAYRFFAEAQEVDEVCWLQACPHPDYPSTFALGASDGSVWVYALEAEPSETPLRIVQTYYQHTASTTAGAWSPSGSLLASVSEEGSLYVYDPFGEAAVAGVASSAGQALIGLTSEDQRFAVEGGLYSIAFAPSGSFLAAGGASGIIRIIGLPILAPSTGSANNATRSQKGAGAKSKAGGSKLNSSASSGQAGQMLASLQAQTDSVETLSFSAPPLTLLAAGSIDGSIALYDSAHRFAVRRLIREAHEDQAVVQVSFSKPSGSAAAVTASNNANLSSANANWILTSCGIDGVVRRWDARGGTAAAGMGLLAELHGHRGGDGGGVMGFVEGAGRIVTAGDEGVALVFEVEESL